MRKIIICEHTSLDGFAAGPAGEMEWIKFDDELFDFVGKLTDQADAALYGRITWQMMDGYWPTAGDPPNASKHDKEHAAWYNKVDKIVLSKSMMNEKKDKTTFIADNIPFKINELKNKPGKNIMIFGSPGAAHTLMQHNLIDEYWLFVNPIILGEGISFFANVKNKINLKQVETKLFPCGVNALNYVVER